MTKLNVTINDTPYEVWNFIATVAREMPSQENLRRVWMQMNLKQPISYEKFMDNFINKLPFKVSSASFDTLYAKDYELNRAYRVEFVDSEFSEYSGYYIIREIYAPDNLDDEERLMARFSYIHGME